VTRSGDSIPSKFPPSQVQISSEHKGSLLAAKMSLPDGSSIGLVIVYGLLERLPKDPDVKYVDFGAHQNVVRRGFGSQLRRVRMSMA
jgi:hypothetical protein